MQISIEGAGWLGIDWVAVGAVATVALLGLAWLELRHINSAFKESQDDHDEQVAELRRQVSLADEAMRNQLRPVVVVRFSDKRGVTNRQMQAAQVLHKGATWASLTNIGPGPALYASGKVWVRENPHGARAIPPDRATIELLGETPTWKLGPVHLAPGEEVLVPIREVTESPAPAHPSDLSFIFDTSCTDVFGVPKQQEGVWYWFV